MLAAIRKDTTISDDVRRLALERAGPFWESLVQYEAQKLVEPLFRELRNRADVVKKIESNSDLSGSVRQRAIALAKEWRQGR